MGGTLKEVLLGDKSTGKEGMIPRNVFNAMVRMDILPLIFFSLLIGATLSVLGDQGRPAIRVISGLNDAVMRLVHWIMVLAPVGIFGLVAGRIGHAGGFKEFLPELMAVGKYSFTVVFGLGLHGLVVLPLILLLIARRNPLRYIKGMSTALLNAFSTASSSATLPLTMRAVEQENKVPPHRELCSAARRYHQHGRHRPLRSHCGDVHRAGLRHHPRTRRADGYLSDSDTCGNRRGGNPGSRACHHGHRPQSR